MHVFAHCVTVLFLSAFTYASLTCDKTGGKLTCTNNHITLVVPGNFNVPKFSVSRKNDTKEYFVMFKQAFQLQGTDPNKSHKIGGTTIALPSLSWNVNEFQLVGSGENEAVEFVIESQSDIVPVFSFGVHLAVAANFMKFNVTIDKMKDKWNDKANFFTLCYQIQESDSSLSSSTIFQSNYNTISIGSHGEAFFSIEQFAVETSTGAQRRVILNSNVTDSWICNHYERFDNRLTHDPTFGFQNTANNSGAVVWIVLGLLLSFITVVSIIVLVLVYVVIRQRGGNYQEL